MTLPDDCAVRLIDLPHGVGAAVSVDDEGFANIYINARLSHDAQKKKLKHELRHLINDDLFNFRTIQEVERHADGKAPSKRPMLMFARDLPRHSPKPAPQTCQTDDDWKNDVYLKLHHFDEQY